MSLAVDTQNLHPSTLSCLEAMQALQEREFRTILDIGCGNGVLAVVAAHLWPARIVAADIAEKAVNDARQAVTEKGLEARVKVVRSDGLSHPEIKEGAPYELVFANLLSELSLKLALDIRSCLAEGGTLVLSGVLEWKAAELEKAYKGLGFEVENKIVSSPWVTYILQRL